MFIFILFYYNGQKPVPQYTMQPNSYILMFFVETGDGPLSPVSTKNDKKQAEEI